MENLYVLVYFLFSFIFLANGNDYKCEVRRLEMLYDSHYANYSLWSLVDIPKSECNCVGNKCPLSYWIGSNVICRQEQIINKSFMEYGYGLKMIKDKYCCKNYKTTRNGYCVDERRCKNKKCDQICKTRNRRAYCECLDGFKRISSTGCTDIDECEYDNGGCTQLCINTNGSYHCACTEGYELDDEYICKIKDPCIYENGGCEQKCRNNQGKVSCHCESGYINYGHSQCIKNGSCFYNNGGCNQKCIINQKSNKSQCKCWKGYHLTNEYFCEDVNECSHNNGGCSHSCVNMKASYKCGCPHGYELHLGRKCKPIDHSSNGTNGMQSKGWDFILILVSAGSVALTTFIIIFIIVYYHCYRVRGKQSAQKPNSENSKEQSNENPMVDRACDNSYEPLDLKRKGENDSQNANYTEINLHYLNNDGLDQRPDSTYAHYEDVN